MTIGERFKNNMDNTSNDQATGHVTQVQAGAAGQGQIQVLPVLSNANGQIILGQQQQQTMLPIQTSQLMLQPTTTTTQPVQLVQLADGQTFIYQPMATMDSLNNQQPQIININGQLLQINSQNNQALSTSAQPQIIVVPQQSTQGTPTANAIPTAATVTSLTTDDSITATTAATTNQASPQIEAEEEPLYNSEFLTLTYGAFITQMLRDYENIDDVNKQLERIGYNMGMRLIEDFLARTSAPRCLEMRETADRIQQAFRIYLNVQPTISNWSAASDEFSLIFENNPLTEFVELPPDMTNLRYSGILCGCIKGALEMVQLEVQCLFVQDQLKGDNVTEIRVKFIRRLEDAIPAGED